MSTVQGNIVRATALASAVLAPDLFGAAMAAETEPGGMVGAMKAEERYPFVAVAYHRYVVGEKDPAAMNCVYDWFYKGDGTGRKTIEIIYLALAEYPDHPPAAVIAALANKKCGS